MKRYASCAPRSASRVCPRMCCSASIYDAMLTQLQLEGGYLVDARERQLLERAYWDADGHRTADTIARPASVVAAKAGFSIPEEKSFLLVEERLIGKAHRFSTEKL